MRLHFISRLALLIAGAFLVVSTQVANWYGSTLQWMFVIGGAFAIAAAAADAMHPSVVQRALDGVFALFGAYMIIEALVFTGQDLKWWSFGCACALAALSAIGLCVREFTTDRVVHELSVTSGAEQPERLTAHAA